MNNIDIAFLIANECEQFLDDPKANEAYMLAVEYDATMDIRKLKKAVKIYNSVTGAGLSVK